VFRYRFILLKKALWGIFFLLLLVGCSGTSLETSRHVVVIDAGHGGEDTGALYGGIHEKDIVLAITKKLYKAFQNEGYHTYITRESDHYLTLGQRTKIADKKEADVFISIHVNAIEHQKGFEKKEGIETYFLQKTRDERSKRIAAKENASLLKGKDILTQHVIVDAVLNGPKVIESHKLAIDVQNKMIDSLESEFEEVTNGGVRAGPFYLLVGASRPSILIETGYITNTKERSRLLDPEYQTAMTEGIVEGVNHYLENRDKEID